MLSFVLQLRRRTLYLQSSNGDDVDAIAATVGCLAYVGDDSNERWLGHLGFFVGARLAAQARKTGDGFVDLVQPHFDLDGRPAAVYTFDDVWERPYHMRWMDAAR